MESISISSLILAIVQLLVIAVIGFFAYNRKIIKESALGFISDFVVNISTPCFIIYKMMGYFDYSFKPSWWVFFLLSLAFFAVGILLSSFVSGSCEVKMLSSFQNSGYLPMTIIYMMFATPVADTLLVYTILYLFGFNFLLWSVGSAFIYRNDGHGFKLKSIFNPPIVCMLAVMLFKLIPVIGTLELPAVLQMPLKMIGNTTFPLAMIYLGARLADSVNVGFDRKLYKGLFTAVVIKLLCVPAVAFLILLKFKFIPELLGFFIMLQACMPSAINVAVATQFRDGDYNFSARAIVVMHIFAVLTVPFWLCLFIKFGRI